MKSMLPEHRLKLLHKCHEIVFAKKRLPRKLKRFLKKEDPLFLSEHVSLATGQVWV